jgi:hypothetical protein
MTELERQADEVAVHVRALVAHLVFGLVLDGGVRLLA